MTDLIKLLDQIQVPETTHVDIYKRRGRGSLQWFLEKDCATHPIHNNNDLEFFICGKEGFASIEADIRNATTSIDLVLWGFDPGMELVREGSVWPRGTTYGDLLTAKAREGVKVRMLLWYAGNIIGKATGNAPDIGMISGIQWSPGKADVKAPKASSSPASWTLTDRANYCQDWWTQALRGGFPNLEIRIRSAHPSAIKKSMKKYLPGSADTFTESVGIAYVGTHHQKPVLIDYAPANAPANANGKKPNTCAYVMGLNSVTDYWDTDRHGFNDPLRELSDAWSGMSKPWVRKPYRDYAIRVTGEALYNINENFVQGWDSADGYGFMNAAPSSGPKLADARQSIKPKDLPKPPGAACRAQILRTYPDKDDATILKAYTLASSNAVNYIYVENQYFQLSQWTRFLKEVRDRYKKGMDAAKAKPTDIMPLHVFVVTPQPERDQMVPKTYDTLSQLGQGQGMGAYDKQVQGQNKPPAKGILDKVTGALSDMAHAVTHPFDPVKASHDEAPTHPTADLETLGIKTLAAMLMTFDAANEAKDIRIKARDSAAQNAKASDEEKANKKAGVNEGEASDVDTERKDEAKIKPGRYREIYIHSKLMLIDDVFTTLGSANLNARSMAGDSEFNICSEDASFAQSSRKRVWGNLAGADFDGKDGSPKATAMTYRNWAGRMLTNQDNRSSGQPPVNNSFIHPFEDPRSAPPLKLA